MNEIVYGYLIVVGTNGRKNWRCSNNKRETNKLKLIQRPKPNGVKQVKMEKHKEVSKSLAVQSKSRHSISYVLSKNNAIVVEYGNDPDTDMFQIGRCTEDQIDFVVNSVPLNHKRDGKVIKHTDPETVSRYACRILVNREPPHEARIYAAGFDCNKNIFLGENAIKWGPDRKFFDGFTTNGVMIRHADVDFDPDKRSEEIKISDSGRASFTNSAWREVSVSGIVYSSLSKRGVPQTKSELNETNILKDGTLIDLCGVTLIWRSAYTDSEIDDHIRSMCCKLNDTHIQCPIGYQTLRISPEYTGWQIVTNQRELPRDRGDISSGGKHHAKQSSVSQLFGSESSRPFVYLKCGHVHGYHVWKADDDNDDCRTCPLCKQRSSFIQLILGQETGFFLDLELPSHCFNPCGHMGSAATVSYWYNVPLPNRVNSDLSPRCPFCYLECADKPVRLIFC